MNPFKRPWLRTWISAAQNPTPGCLFVFLGSINSPDTHPVPSEAIDQLLRTKVTFLLPRGEQNQEVCERLRPRMQPESPLSLWKQEASCGPAPIQANLPPPSPPWPPAPVAAYLRLLIRGCGDHKPGAENFQRLGKESALLLWRLFVSAQRAKEKQHLFSEGSGSANWRESPVRKGFFSV